MRTRLASYPGRIVLVTISLLATLAGCSERSRPNVLLVTFDTARADAFGVYGAPEGASPTVDSIAADGVVFEQVTTPVPLTLPAHTSLLSGTFPRHHSVHENGVHAVPQEVETLAEILRESGYRTGAFVGAFVLDARWGLDQGFDTYSGSFDTTSSDVFSLGDLQRTANRVVDDVLEWLRQGDDRPFFAWVHFYDPHYPYDPPDGWKEKRGGGYAGEIAFADHQLARILERLEQSGKLGNTIIVITSDHGEGFGEHGETGHGLLLYEEALHVPLIIRAPRQLPPASRVATPVSLVDVFPTITELTNVRSPLAVQGNSLLPLSFGEGEHGTPIYAETTYPRSRFNWSSLRALRQGELKVIESSEPELYDLGTDPGETTNLLNTRESEYRRTRARLKVVEEEMAKSPLAPPTSIADSETRAKLAALGYLSGGVQSAPSDELALPAPRRKIHRFNELSNARGMMAAGRFEEAEAELNALAQAEPAMLEVHVALGELYLRSRKAEDAVGAFRNALNLTSGDPSLIAGLATAELHAGRAREALELVEVARSGSVDDPRFRFVAGRAWLALGELEAARREFDALLNLNPKAAAAHVELSAIALAEGLPDVAIRHARDALTHDRGARGARLHLARALERTGKLEEAWREAQAELEQSPGDFRAALYVAELAERTGRDDHIDENLRRAIDLEPRVVKPYLALATRMLRRGDHPAEGIRLVETALELGPEPRDRAHAYFLLADLHNRAGRETLSRRYAEQGRRIRDAG